LIALSHRFAAPEDPAAFTARQSDAADMAAIQEFIDEAMVSRVLNVVKSGKEATVYRCRAHPSLGPKYVAAKVYHGAQFRNFNNAATYNDGRLILNGQVRRAVAGHTEFGREAQSAIWTGYEYETLCTLFDAGAAVPEPFAQTDRAVLMEFITNAGEPAPQLAAVSLEPDEAQHVWESVIATVRLAFSLNLVHSDLSAYNVLYSDDGPVVIDLPQAIDPRFNTSARKLFERDVRNVAKYCNRQGARADADGVIDDLWRRFTFSDW
jgi:RIO kinase 1